MSRLDVLLLGATGFAGRLTAERLAEFAHLHGLSWGLAGRDAARLAAVRDALAARFPAAATAELRTGDVGDPESLRALARSTRVLVSTVGPYARYGSPVVAACVEEHTHYADLTGETPWIRRMIDLHHDEATARGVRIVHCCGFDSIPSDIGTLLLQEEAIRRWGAPCPEVRLFVRKARGGFSGGTIASMIQIVEAAQSDPAVRRVLADPYALNPEGQREGPASRDRYDVAHSELIGAWTAPFVMAAINTRVVRRSSALLGDRYGRSFLYGESQVTGPGLRGRLAAEAVRAGMGAFVAGVANGTTRRLLQRHVLPAPGEGPSAELVENGYFVIELVGRGPSGATLRVEVRGRRDPGYGATASMLAASAFALAGMGAEESPRGGVLTPASSFGLRLLPLVEPMGVTFRVLD